MTKTTEKYFKFWECLQKRYPTAFKNHRIKSYGRYMYVNPPDRTVSIGLLENAVCVRFNVPSNSFARIDTFIKDLESLLKHANLTGEFERPKKLGKYASFYINYSTELSAFSALSDSQKNIILDWVYNCWLIFTKYCAETKLA